MAEQKQNTDKRKIFYNKLVRDEIQNKIESNGEMCEIREITDENEFEQELLKKITEEAQALSRTTSRTEFLGEYADLMVVLDALTALMEFSEADIKTAIEENVNKKGLYKKRHYLHWSSDGNYKSNETPQGIK